MNTDDSPDELQPDAGVRRINKKVFGALILVLATFVVVLSYSMLGKRRSPGGQKSDEQEKHNVADTSAAAAAAIRTKQHAGEIPEQPAEKGPPRLKGAQRSGLIAASQDVARAAVAETKSMTPDPLIEEKRRQAAKQQQMLEAALTSTTRVGTMDEVASSRRSPDAAAAQVGYSPASAAAAAARANPLPSGALNALGNDPDPNKQADKEAFAERKRALGYLVADREPPLSEYELKAGTVIPAALISGINSDIPGEIVAQVTQNVYDSASGNFLLIPQGSKLVGAYNSLVAVGQERVQVSWTRVNFPDGSALDIQGMSGADQAGYSGFNDKVNNHYVKVFGSSIMLSLFSAGAQLSQPRTTSPTGTPTAAQEIAASMGQQFAATGSEITRRNLQVQPTLEIRPGYRFSVMVNKDIVLRPYVETP